VRTYTPLHCPAELNTCDFDVWGLPEELSSLTGLEALSLYEGAVSPRPPPSFSFLSCLQRLSALDLSRVNIRQLPAELALLPALRSLHIEGIAGPAAHGDSAFAGATAADWPPRLHTFSCDVCAALHLTRLPPSATQLSSLGLRLHHEHCGVLPVIQLSAILTLMPSLTTIYPSVGYVSGHDTDELEDSWPALLRSSQRATHGAPPRCAGAGLQCLPPHWVHYLLMGCSSQG